MDEPKNAIRELKKIEKQDVDFIPEAMGMMQDCYLKLGRMEEFSQYLHSVCQLHDGITPVLMLSDVKQETEGVEAAIEYMAGELRKRPSVRGLGRLIEYALINANGETRENLLIVKSLTDKLQEKKHAYNCTHCGFTGKSLHWQCPGCKYWNTVKPIQGVIGE
jgi:lipopolysaccharide biosynthesis regulator YciM